MFKKSTVNKIKQRFNVRITNYILNFLILYIYCPITGHASNIKEIKITCTLQITMYALFWLSYFEQ